MPPQIHGIAERCYQWVKRLRELGHTVHVCSSKYSDDVQVELESLPLPFNKDVASCLGSFKLISSIRKNNYDIIHIVGPSMPSLFYWINFPALIMGIPIIVSHHVDIRRYVNEYYKNNFLARLFLTKVGEVQYFYQPLAFAAKICGPTHQSLYEFYGTKYNSQKLSVFSTGVNSQLFSPALKSDISLREYYKDIFRKRGITIQKFVGYIGRIAPEKSIDIVLKLAQLNPEIGFVIVGNGPQKDELQKKYDLKNVLFVGVKRGEELARHYSLLDVMISPSTSETFGFTILESLSCGTPVLIPNVEVFKEIHEPIGDWLVDVQSNSLVLQNYNEKLNDILSDDNQINFERTQEHIKKFTWEKSGEDLEKIYQESIGHKVNSLFVLLSFMLTLILLPTSWIIEILLHFFEKTKKI
jgi:glycosyltransferase involved in cell wall biosynthesis